MIISQPHTTIGPSPLAGEFFFIKFVTSIRSGISMELNFERKIATNTNGYSYLNIPKQVAAALGTKRVILRVKDQTLEVIPQKNG